MDVIEKIKKWAKGETGALDEPICWVNAAAGFGKSAIARTIAEWCEEQGILGSSYFFLRGLGDRSKISSLVPTLAYHFSRYLPSTKSFIEEQLKDEPNTLRQPVPYQFKKLLVDPFRLSNKSSLPPEIPAVVIIIDALDECPSSSRPPLQRGNPGHLGSSSPEGSTSTSDKYSKQKQLTPSHILYPCTIL